MRPASRRIVGLAVLAIAAYLARFGASWWLLTRVDPARFDPHGFGLLGDAMLLSALALPLLLLLWWVLRRRRPWRGLLASASRPGWTILSVGLLVLIGAPTPNQLWAFRLLPPTDHWPVLLSALLWFAVCAVLRALAVARQQAGPGPSPVGRQVRQIRRPSQ